MTIKSYENIDDLIPGVYAFINENVAISKTEKLEVGRTVTALLAAPDYFILADDESENPDAIKNVRIEPNKMYVVSDPAKMLSTIRGEHLRTGILTETQKASMRSPQLESACQIAADLGKTFAFIKIVKRDGTSPDINNVHEMYEAHEHALERIKTINAGCLKPFGYSLLKDRFELSVKNKWVDEENNVFLIFTVKELEKVLGCGKNKVIQIKKELTEYGLLEEERQGLNRPNRLYVLNVDATRRF